MDGQLIDRAISKAAMASMVWGRDDCCLWVADIVLEATGIDIASPLRGYRSAAGAISALRKYAGGGIIEAATRRAKEIGVPALLHPHAPDSHAIGIVASPDGPALALHHAEWPVWYARSADGIAALPIHSAVMAWETPPCRRS